MIAPPWDAAGGAALLEAEHDEEHARMREARHALWQDAAALADATFAPRERMTPLEWGERHYLLPETAAMKGPFRVATLPYLRGVFDALADPRVRRVVVAKGSQLAFTTVGEIWTGWTMAHAPAAMLSIWPTEGLLKRYVLTRINPMMESVEPLKAVFERSGRRESDDSIKHKGFPGGTVDLISAKSTNELRSISAERIHVSELDELDEDLGEQGDPLELARRALRTYWNAKEYLECTPTIHEQSRVWRELGLTTWREYYVPCPHCGHEQVMRWRDGTEDGDSAASGTFRFVYEVDSAGQVVPGSTHYVCVECACLVEESWKRQMVDAGEWRARFPERVTYEGFHLPAWYNPLPGYSWDKCAQLWVNGVRKPAARKVFVNTMAGLPYRETGEQADAHQLMAHAEPYAAEVPAGVVVLTVGIDVQGDRLEYAIWGWGAGEEAWLIRWARIEGDPALDTTWTELGDALSEPLIDEAGELRFPHAIAIDAGFQGEKVKRWCTRWRAPNGVRPIHVIGRDGRTRPIIEAPGADAKKRRRVKRPSHIVGSDTCNDLLYGRMQVHVPGPEYFHFPDTLDAAFYQQFTAEELRTVYVSGKPVRKWVLPDFRRNEALDLTRYAYAALHSLGRRVLNDLARLAQLPPEMRQTRAARRRGRAPRATDATASAPASAPSPATPAGSADRSTTPRTGGRRRRGMISRGIE